MNRFNNQQYGPAGQSNMPYVNQQFDQSFTKTQPLIDRPEYINQGNLLHNNIGKKILDDETYNYHIHISSADRDIIQNPSPFKFKVTFDDNLSKCNINKKFRNIKYIALDGVVIPRTIAVDTRFAINNNNNSEPTQAEIYYNYNNPTINDNISGTGDSDLTNIIPSIYPAGSDYVPISGQDYVPSVSSSPPIEPPIIATPANPLKTMKHHRYLIVKIGEIDSNKLLGTSIIHDRNTFHIYPDKCYGIDGVLWKPVHRQKIEFSESLLTNINSMTISLLDEQGNILNIVNNTNPGLNIIGNAVPSLPNDPEHKNLTNMTNFYVPPQQNTNYVKPQYVSDGKYWTNKNYTTAYIGMDGEQLVVGQEDMDPNYWLPCPLKDYNTFVKIYGNIPSVNYTNSVIQVEYDIRFGVVEAEINTKPAYLN